MTPSRAGRRALSLPLLAPFVLFADALAGRRLLADGDAYRHYLPLHVLAARAWRAGQAPAWNAFAFSGYPLLATGQVGAFYPPNLAFLVFGPVLANNLGVIVSFAVAGTGAAVLARKLTGDDVGAAVSGLAFGTCGFLFAHVQHQPIDASIAWLPWALVGFEWLRGRSRARGMVVGTLAVGLSALAGHGQMFAVVVAVVVLYAVAIAALERRGGPLLAAAAIVVLGAGLGAIQLVPTLSILGATDRSVLSYRHALSYSFPRSHAVLLAFPYLFGGFTRSGLQPVLYRGRWSLTELSGYPGLAAAVLAAAGLVAGRRDRRALVLAGLGLLGVIGALGGSTPVGHLIYFVPGFGRFRAWARYAVVTDLAVAVLAAYGVAALRGGTPASRRRARAARLMAGAAAALVVALAVAVPVLPGVRHLAVGGQARLAALAVPAGAAVLAALLALNWPRWPRLVAVLVPAVVFLDGVLAYGLLADWRTLSPSPATLRRDLSAAVAPDVGRPSPAPGGIVRTIYVGPDPGVPRQYVDVTDVKGIRSANGFDPLAPRDYLRAVGEMSYFGSPARPQLLWDRESHVLDLLRISTVVVRRPAPAQGPGPGTLLDHGSPVAHTPFVRYDRAPNLPEAYLVGEAVVGRPPAGSVAAGTPPGTSGPAGPPQAAAQPPDPFDPAARAYLDRACSACAAADRAGPAGNVFSTRWGQDHVSVRLFAQRPAMLVVSQAWFAGWHAKVDGRPAPVLRVDGLVQGVPVPAGAHRVVLSYRAPGLVLGAAVSAASALMILAFGLVGERRLRLLRSSRSRRW
ncbi:MAG: YfhO family protein [Acidimicrobiales bacterium]